MNVLFASLLSAMLVIAAAVQVLADAATGRAGADPSLPRFLSSTLGSGPAYALGLLRHSSRIDVLDLNAHVNRLDRSGDYRGADELQREIVERLSAGDDKVLLADALWRLGQLDAEIGYVEKPQRRAQWEEALKDYERALQLEPLSETILLAAANQALLNGDRKDALDYFNRAVAVDPASTAAREGLRRARTGEGEPPPYVAPAEWRPKG
ncbi:MAG: hypothetical protein ACREJX_13000 [Polyangiaceae bacterium]